MKKFLAIIVLGLLFSGNAYSNDKFIGKWISKHTNSVFEIKKSDNEYKFYFLYSGRWFQKYDNKLVGVFKKKNLAYKGTTTQFDTDYNAINISASYKIKAGELVVKSKGVSPFTNQKFNFKSTFERFNEKDKYIEGESLFGIKIGDNIKNYKILTKINLGNEMVGYIEGIVIKSPEPNSEFESYIVRTVKDTDQIYQIFAYLGANIRELSYGECESIMQPYRNYIIEKYENDYLVMDEGTSLVGTVNSSTTTFSLMNKDKQLIYSVWTSCDEPLSNSIGNKDQHIARISLIHEDLSLLSRTNKTKKENTKKKKF